MLEFEIRMAHGILLILDFLVADELPGAMRRHTFPSNMVEMLFQMQCNSSVYLELNMPKKTNPLEVVRNLYLRYRV